MSSDFAQEHVPAHRLSVSARAAWGRLRQSNFAQQVLLAPLEPLTHDSVFRIRFLALALLLGEPAYCLFWSYVVPQPAEDWALRLPSVVFAAPLLFRRFHAWVGTRGLEWHGSILATYSLPFAMFGLYRENGYTDVRMGIFVVGIYSLFIMTDWRLAIVESALGVVLAWWTIPLLGAFALPPLDHLAIFGFAYFTAVMLAMSDANLRFLRARAALAAIGVMAHEFRTPLASAAMLTESLQSEAAVQACTRTKARLMRLHASLASIRAMTDYQITSTKIMGFPAERTVFPLGRLARQAVALLPTAPQSVRDCIEVVVINDCRVHANEQLMRQIVQNLLSNALNSVGATGRAIQPGDVAVIIDGDRQHVRMRVADKGVGVSPGNMHRLFEPFFSTSTMPAHGLGLTMCRNAVASLGGHIWCTSLPGQGATFHVLLPRPAGLAGVAAVPRRSM